MAYRSTIARGPAGAPLSAALLGAMDDAAPTACNLYAAGREICARLFDVDPLEIYTRQSLNGLLRARLHALTGAAPGEPGTIEAMLRRIAGAKPSERAMLAAQVYERLNAADQLYDKWLRGAHRMPGEVIAAHYLQAALDE